MNEIMIQTIYLITSDWYHDTDDADGDERDDNYSSSHTVNITCNGHNEDRENIERKKMDRQKRKCIHSDRQIKEGNFCIKWMNIE